jgi:DNA-binding response OmpR family regulator
VNAPPEASVTPKDTNLIFVVDDDPAQTALTRRWLKTDGYSVLELGSGQACLDALQAVRPAAICLDLNMDGLSGLSTLRAIRGSLPEVPVFIISGSNDVDAVVESKRLGADDYLLKPLDPIRLLAKLKAALVATGAGD